MEPLKVTQGIHWVGALDPDLEVFDIVMPTPKGTSYNSYLVEGDEVAVIDGVKDYTWAQQEERIRQLVDPTRIRHIIVNHTEPDHAGGVVNLLEMCPSAEVLGTPAAIRLLGSILNSDFPSRVVKDGEELELGGGKTLRFIHSPFWHWPDSMFTFAVQDGVLFSCDGFGTHYAGPGLFDDEAEDFQEEFRHYYDAIMGPFKPHILKGLKKIEPLEPKVIAPSHGPILRAEPEKYVELYRRWSTDPQSTPGKILVAYVSAYGYTEELAGILGSALLEEGLRPSLVEITGESLADLAEKIRLSDGLLLGSPTFNRDALAPVWQLLAHVSAVTSQGKPAAAFGSYGWSGEAVPHLENRLKGLNFKVMTPGLRAVLKPSPEERDQALEFAQKFAAFVRGED